MSVSGGEKPTDPLTQNLGDMKMNLDLTDLLDSRSEG